MEIEKILTDETTSLKDRCIFVFLNHDKIDADLILNNRDKYHPSIIKSLEIMLYKNVSI